MDQRNKISFGMPLEFKMARPVECPYLDFKTEQRLAADITGRNKTYNTLARAGFRRVENWVYKPVCRDCTACIPIRIPSGNGVEGQLNVSRNQRRVINRNKDLDRIILSNVSTYHHFDLFSRYLNSRHDDGQMVGMDFNSYTAMVTASPIETKLIEYSLDGQVIGIIMIDMQDDGLSAVYSFFDPDASDRSLGTFMVLDCASLAYELKMDYVYLGYYVERSRKMRYKSRFTPSEYLINGTWTTVSQND